jgi:hypothetical protein
MEPTKPMQPPRPSGELSKDTKNHDLKHHPGLVYLISTKKEQDKQTTFLHR